MPVVPDVHSVAAEVLSIEPECAQLRATQLGPLDPASALGFLLASLDPRGDAPLARALAGLPTDDPHFLRANAARFVRGVTEVDPPHEWRLEATDDAWLAHLAPGVAWTWERTRPLIPLPIGPEARARAAGVPVPPAGQSLAAQLVMAPQLQMAIRMLALDAAALREELARVRAENPALAVRDGVPPASLEGADLEIARADDRWIARVRDPLAAAVYVDPAAERVLDDPREADDARAAMQAHLNAARWFVRSLDQRNRTLVKLGAVLGARFAETFATGATPAPVPAHEIAETMGVHESTVARLVTGRSLATPHGVLPLAAFVRVRKLPGG